MQVYEKINQLKGIEASMYQMVNWAEVNRIPLCCFEDELELDEGIVFDDVLKELVSKLCGCMITERERVVTFLESEYPKAEYPLIDMIE